MEAHSLLVDLPQLLTQSSRDLAEDIVMLPPEQLIVRTSHRLRTPAPCSTAPPTARFRPASSIRNGLGDAAIGLSWDGLPTIIEAFPSARPHAWAQSVAARHEGEPIPGEEPVAKLGLFRD